VTYWPQTSEALAAWIQAIGTIVAVGAGVVLVFLQHRLTTRYAKEQTANEAFGIALLLEAEVIALQGAIDVALGRNEFMPVSAPSGIVEALPKLHLLGGPGKELLLLVSIIRADQGMIADWQRDNYFGTVDPETFALHRERLALMQQGAEKAAVGIREMVDQDKG